MLGVALVACLAALLAVVYLKQRVKKQQEDASAREKQLEEQRRALIQKLQQKHDKDAETAAKLPKPVELQPSQTQATKKKSKTQAGKNPLDGFGYKSGGSGFRSRRRKGG